MTYKTEKAEFIISATEARLKKVSGYRFNHHVLREVVEAGLENGVATSGKTKRGYETMTYADGKITVEVRTTEDGDVVASQVIDATPDMLDSLLSRIAEHKAILATR